MEGHNSYGFGPAIADLPASQPSGEGLAVIASAAKVKKSQEKSLHTAAGS
jgi:hypothetical protein